MLEPVGRNSAPAIAAAALLVTQTDPQAVIWVMAADAAIEDTGALHQILAQAVAAAQVGRIATLGMKPTAPETGYGYMAVGEPIAEAPGVHAVARFIEKPDAASAASLVASGALWNAGMFVFAAETMIEELQLYAPEVLSAVRRAVEGATQDLDFIRLQPAAFAASPNISIDYAVAGE